MGKDRVKTEGENWRKYERDNWGHYYRKQKQWKESHSDGKEIKFRGNKKWCEKFGEDLSLPRFIGDKKIYIIDGKHYYPPYEN